MITTEPSSSKAKQTVLDDLHLQQTELRLPVGELKMLSQNTRLSHCYLHYKNRLLFDDADLQSLAALVDQCIEFGQQHQGLK